jgi:hypothetical protein
MKASRVSLRVGTTGVRFFAAAFSVLLATAPAVAGHRGTSRLVMPGTLPVSLQGATGYRVESPDNGPNRNFLPCPARDLQWN